MRRNVPVFLGFILFASLTAQAQQRLRPIPSLEHVGSHFRLLVDGKPFLILGGQAHNSSATNPQDLEPVWRSLTALHANTAEVPVYWELIEPQPAQFDFHLVDEVLAGARRNHLRLVLLWFASWKNGEMHYTPEWVKRDKTKFRRVVGARGEELEILSPLCEAARDADARAFATLLEHLRRVDEADRTVIMIQVENETGLLGTDRDYAPEATRRFTGPVPAELMAYLSAHRDALVPSLKAAWAAAGFRSAGTWPEVFGELAPEVSTAWHIARYVDKVAEAGKQVYPLPMYANVWLINPGNARAGQWPSGGPTEHVLDIWKAAAPHLDLLAPDIYLPTYRETCITYTRPDNPLFVPEVQFIPHNAANAFLTFGGYDGLGFSPFGIDNAVEDGKVTATAAEYEDTYRVLSPLLDLLAAKQGSNKLHAIIQSEDGGQSVRLDKRLVAVVDFTKPYSPEGSRGRGMIVELAPDDYVVVGAGFTVAFRELTGPPHDAQFLSLEEGTFEGERWISTRRLNGDELHVLLPEKAKILRVRLLHESESILH
jgi:beta-galactosidase GanA